MTRYAANPEKYRAEARARRAADPEKAKAIGLRSRRKHRDSINRRQRERYTPERVRSWRRINPGRTLIQTAKARAVKAGLPYDLTKDWVSTAWTGRCALTGLPFDAPTDSALRAMRMSPLMASIDRIDPAEGYTQSNCRFVCLGVNSLKGAGTDNQMYQIAEALLRNRK